jgi:hypothetical protein
LGLQGSEEKTLMSEPSAHDSTTEAIARRRREAEEKLLEHLQEAENLDAEGHPRSREDRPEAEDQDRDNRDAEKPGS